jgi:hypothetical protein
VEGNGFGKGEENRRMDSRVLFDRLRIGAYLEGLSLLSPYRTRKTSQLSS